MTSDEEKYRRLLRWYPRAWRESNGEVMLGTLLDAAEADAAGAPSTRAHAIRGAWSLRMHGLGERLTPRANLGFAIASLVAFFLVAAAWIGFSPAAVVGVTPAVGVFVGPTLFAISVAGLMRAGGLLSAPAAVAVCIISAAALACALGAALAWSVGFDEADAGATRSAFSQLFPAFFLTGWAIGGVAVGLVVDGVIGRDSKPLPRVLGAITVALFAAPAIGLSLLTPTPGALASIGLVFIAASRFSADRRSPAASHPPRATTASPSTRNVSAPSPLAAMTAASPRDAATRGERRAVGTLAGFGTAATLLCIAFAFTGSLRTDGALDPTRAMQLGLGAGALAGLPVLAAGAMVAARRSHTPRGAMSRHPRASRAWAPVWAFAGALTLSAIGQFAGDAWPFWLAGTTALGVGVALIIWSASTLDPALRLLLACGAGAASAVTLGIHAVAMSAFLLAAAGIALSVWAVLPRRHSASTPCVETASLARDPM